MYNVHSRLNAVFSQAVTVLAIGAALMAAMSIVSAYTYPAEPIASITATIAPLVQIPVGYTGRVVDRTVVRATGTADFSSCFNWNTKLVYVFLVVEYQTDKFDLNEITIYDKIITESEAKMTLSAAAEYPVEDMARASIVGKPAVLKLKYNVMRYSGLSSLYEVEAARFNFTFPSRYERK